VIVLAAAVLAAGLIIAALLIVGAARDRLLRERMCDKVVATLKTGAAFSGVLFKVDGQALILRDTQALGAGPGGDHLAVDGELILFRADIEYLQRP
jgi:ABC-type Fe3+-siderophore transport system permease subunit